MSRGAEERAKGNTSLCGLVEIPDQLQKERGGSIIRGFYGV